MGIGQKFVCSKQRKCIFSVFSSKFTLLLCTARVGYFGFCLPYSHENQHKHPIKISWVARMGQNFHDYSGFQPKTTPVQRYATQCKILSSYSSRMPVGSLVYQLKSKLHPNCYESF